MNIREAVTVPENQLEVLLSNYQYMSGRFRENVSAPGIYGASPYIWRDFILAGRKLADALLRSRDIPPSKADEFTAAVRVFSAVRVPSSIVTWYDKNRKHFGVLDLAATWKPKNEASKDRTQGSFKIGPFTVHNTFGLLGEDLKGPVTALEAVIRMVHSQLAAVPAFDKALYGDVFLIGRLRQPKYLAWYQPNTDEIYLRTDIKLQKGDLHTFVHELAHRYWHKFMPLELKSRFKRRHTVCQYPRRPAELPPLPRVGESIGIHIQGTKEQPKVIKIEGDRLFLEGGGFITISQLVRFHRKLRAINCFPTQYASKNVEEHFCEVMGLKATGQLTGDHLEAFQEIFGGKTSMETRIAGLPRVVNLNGQRYTWKRGSKSTGLGAVGEIPEFRPWYLQDAVGHPIVMLHHTHGSHMGLHFPSEWKITVNIPNLPEERTHKGAWDSLTLLKRIPSPDGDTGTAEAMALGVRAYQQKGREHIKVGMAATFVSITRDMLEDWLTRIPHLHEKWYRQPGRAGVYLLPLSHTVAIKLSSTVGQSDEVVSVGKGSMQLALVSRVTGQTINKKAQGQSYFARTTNWEKTWREGIERIRAAYLKAQGFYDALATITDRKKYKDDILAKIKAIPDWEEDSRLSDWYRRVFQDGILTETQIAYIEDKASHPASAPRIDEDTLHILKELWKRAKMAGDEYLMKFCQDVAEKRIKRGLPMTGDATSGQQGYFNRMKAKYRIL